MKTSTAPAVTVRREACENCLFGLVDLIPDPNAPHVPGREKPKVAGRSCHISRPSNYGFPIVRPDEFCALFTDRATKEQPLARFLNPNSQHKAYGENGHDEGAA